MVEEAAASLSNEAVLTAMDKSLELDVPSAVLLALSADPPISP